MPSKLAISLNCGRREGVQTTAFGAAASKRRSKLVVTRRTFPSVLRQRSSNIWCALRFTSAAGRRMSPTARSMFGTGKSCSSNPKMRSAAITEPTPEIAPRFCDASTSLLARLSGSARSLARTARARPKKSGRWAFSRDTPAPQKNSTRPSSRAVRSSSGNEGPLTKNLKIWLSSRCVLHPPWPPTHTDRRDLRSAKTSLRSPLRSRSPASPSAPPPASATR
jgi:hypothetical protein